MTGYAEMKSQGSFHDNTPGGRLTSANDRAAAATRRREAKFQRCRELFPEFPEAAISWVYVAAVRLERGPAPVTKAALRDWLRTNVPEMDPDTGQPKGEA